MTAPEIKRPEGTQPGSKAKRNLPWNVILYNDWEHSMPQVVVILKTVIPGMSLNPDYSRSRVSLMNRGNAISSGWDRCARSKRSFWRTHRSLCASEPKPPRSFMNNPG